MELKTFNPLPGSTARVDCYLHTPVWEMQKPREIFPAVVICPGGAYAFVSLREGEPVALQFFARGYNVFVLSYSVGEKAGNFLPLRELSETFRIIRETPEYRVDRDRIAVCGFSAGGHLAASLGVLWNDLEFLKTYDNRGGINRPNAMILGYPVLLADEFTHELSIRNVSGAEPGSEKYRYFSLPEHVGEGTPPAFLWHTAADDAVPVENTLRFALALSANKIPFEAHIFPYGGHGVATATAETMETADPYLGRWVGMAIDWLDLTFDFRL